LCASSSSAALDGGTGVDVTPIVVAALCVLVGMLEVVLLVGAAFAVAARRQVRDLGLLAANGGAGADVRRVLLAQGLVLGVLSSVLGTASGVALFLGAHDRLEAVFGSYVPWRSDIDWRAVVLVAVLGATTSVVAALLPGWSVGRLTPVAALSGPFPVRAGESRAHRGALLLAGAGLALLLLGGWATSYTFRPHGGEVTLAPAVAALGLLLLVAGVVWGTPWLVRQAARAGARLPLSGRYAFRDAGRHRFRTASAVVALAITVAGAVLASFVVSAAVRQGVTDGWPPEHGVGVDSPAAGALG
jgi:putative ABC transport system permease protein